MNKLLAFRKLYDQTSKDIWDMTHIVAVTKLIILITFWGEWKEQI